MGSRAFALLLALSLAFSASGDGRAESLPRIESRGGRHALIVDRAPFLVLGAQANNSGNYPAMLGTVFPVVDALGANTLEMPVAWEQLEPAEGRFDFGFVEALLAAARA